MRCYDRQHRFYAGIDLHARTMHLGVLDTTGAAVGRFATVEQFLAYARLVRCQHESGGKVLGSGGAKIDNGHLRWAFGAAACLFLRSSERAKRWKERQARKRGAGQALAIRAARLGRAVYHRWRKREAFDEDRFGQGSGVAVQA